MRTIPKRLTAIAAGLVVAVLGASAHAASAPIQNSKHNMNLVFGANTIQDNQICLPCHAPHSQPDKTQDTLWNHVMPSQSYTLYGSGTSYVGLDETSKKCLSCHDGSVAVDSYGAGGTVTTGTHFIGTTNDAGGNSTAGFQIGGGGDLSHDHPVGIQYPGLSADGKTWVSTRGFKDPTKFNTTSYYSAIQNPDSSYVPANYVNDGGTSIKAVGGASISLSSTTSGGVTYSNVVGCGSCHTPHTNTYNFLHVPNTNSQLCLTCHDK